MDIKMLSSNKNFHQFCKVWSLEGIIF